MKVEEKMEKLKKEIDFNLRRYLLQATRETEKKDKEAGRMLKHMAKIIMTGGKRIRPILLYVGYLAAGGKEKKEIIKAGIGIELIHNYFLAHDDIMDRGKMRHDIETINTWYEKNGISFFPNCKDLKHLGVSMAIMAGDLSATMGAQVFLNSNFDAGFVNKAISYLQLTIKNTIVGQIQDFYLGNKKQISEKEILTMYENKTAKYTVENPLKLGAILAGANETFLRKISTFAIPVGMAFQIQDDILGLFETSQKIGKDSGSDIKEGKKTLLLFKTLEKATEEEKKFMKENLGNKKISFKNIEKFKKIIKSTGALEYNQNLARKLIEKGKRELKKIRMTKEAKSFLLELADYLIGRRA